MPETATRLRAPRGTKIVSDAFFKALHAIPEARQAEVARSAQIAIRDELKVMRDKSRAAATKAKLKAAAEAPAPKTRAKPAPSKAKPAAAKKATRGRRAMRMPSAEA